MANAPSPKKAKPAAKSPAARSTAAAAPARTWDSGYFLTAKHLLTEQEVASAIASSKWRHYVYGLCLDNGAVFYVGKGVRGRVLEHAKAAAQGDDSEKSQYIRFIGDRLRYTLFLQCQDDVYARGHEAYLIAGHHDVLTNIAPASSRAYAQMFKPLEPLDPLEKALADLVEIGEYITAADEECKRAMRNLIASHPPVIRTLTDEELAWATDADSGAVVRSVIEQFIAGVPHGGQ